MRHDMTITAKQRQVEQRIRDAVRTLRQLPSPSVQGYFNTWPAIIREPLEILQMEPDPLRTRPQSKDITQMEEVLFVWLKWLEVEERRLVWRRCERVPWKLICVEFGYGRTKSWEIYKRALGKIAAQARL